MSFVPCNRAMLDRCTLFCAEAELLVATCELSDVNVSMLLFETLSIYAVIPLLITLSLSICNIPFLCFSFYVAVLSPVSCVHCLSSDKLVRRKTMHTTVCCLPSNFLTPCTSVPRELGLCKVTWCLHSGCLKTS